MKKSDRRAGVGRSLCCSFMKMDQIVGCGALGKKWEEMNKSARWGFAFCVTWRGVVGGFARLKQ